jgi:hypothetical protein
MKPFIRSILLAIVIVAVVSCSSTSANQSLKPGVYLKSGGELTELARVKGSLQQTGIPQTKEIQPVLLFYLPLDDVKQVRLRSASSGIDFETLSAQSDIYEIRPSSSLEAGVYCLSLGGPLMSPAEVSYWCFEIASAKKDQQAAPPPSSNSTVASNGPTVTPPGGFAWAQSLESWSGTGDSSFAVLFFTDGKRTFVTGFGGSGMLSCENTRTQQGVLFGEQVPSNDPNGPSKHTVDNGKFALKLHDMSGQTWDIEITGEFISSDQVEGSFRFDSAKMPQNCKAVDGKWSGSPRR